MKYRYVRHTDDLDRITEFYTRVMRFRVLGRSMTEFLLKEAIGQRSGHIGLVASEGGARIYSKMGFEHVGHMVTYRFGD